MVGLIQYGLVEAFADIICLWWNPFGFRVVDIILMARYSW
ncbi:hypothetical protein VCHC51A1_1885 [Vibrio cholerae HC-51A1]|nr:hypothetical protein VCHC02A1_1973 [Vibrio cholerae HC-02A1]EKG90531.1 hypothetical protein VCHC51A1_1885 [Vibrio cholerae HC-51A1]EKL13239.1 hypothetical protein VCHC59A1_2023 [Vibrio cholerae HC-59A1]